jgi:hypothetical protein
VLCKRCGESHALFIERWDHVEQREHSHDTRNIDQLCFEEVHLYLVGKKLRGAMKVDPHVYPT